MKHGAKDLWKISIRYFNFMYRKSLSKFPKKLSHFSSKLCIHWYVKNNFSLDSSNIWIHKICWNHSAEKWSCMKWKKQYVEWFYRILHVCKDFLFQLYHSFLCRLCNLTTVNKITERFSCRQPKIFFSSNPLIY